MELTVWLRVALAGLLGAHNAAHAHKFQQILENGAGYLPRLNFSSPSPLIFHYTFGLLQQWPNTFFPNGHTIAPCTVAKNVNLYHAREDGDLPPSPEWFAFDAAMAYMIAGASPESRMLTYRTTRDIQCLYFDGTSASLMDDGSMDAQMLLIHNNSGNIPDWSPFQPPPRQNDSYGQPPCRMPGRGSPTDNCTHWNPLQAEYDRAEGLCHFIKEKGLGGYGWGYEGIVRMNAAFELIWCDFSSPSVRLVSWLNSSSPLLDGIEEHRRPWSDEVVSNSIEIPSLRLKVPARYASDDLSLSRWPDNAHPFQQYSIYQWFTAATRRYGFFGGIPGRGEGRVRIDSCRLFTFYDPALAHQERTRVWEEQRQLNLTELGYWKPPDAEPGRTEALQKLRRRRYQRPRNVSTTDGLYMRRAVEERMRAASVHGHGECSGIDWLLAGHEIVTYYSADIHRLLKLFENAGDLSETMLRERVAQIREVVHALWVQFYEYPLVDRSNLGESFSLSALKSREAYERCTAQYQPLNVNDLSETERTTYSATLEVITAICSELLPLFLNTEQLWLANFNNASAPLPEPSSPIFTEVAQQLLVGHHSLEELMAWLGWEDQWTTCSPACELGEICFIPVGKILVRKPHPMLLLMRVMSEYRYGQLFSFLAIDVVLVGATRRMTILHRNISQTTSKSISGCPHA